MSRKCVLKRSLGASAEKLGSLSFGNASPWTSAPRCDSHSESQVPLNPVLPVIRTERPFQKSASPVTKLSRADGLHPTWPLADVCRATCPSLARNRGDGKQTVDPRELSAPSDPAPIRCRRP